MVDCVACLLFSDSLLMFALTFTHTAALEYRNPLHVPYVLLTPMLLRLQVMALIQVIPL
jgi:hypothetical protein